MTLVQALQDASSSRTSIFPKHVRQHCRRCCELWGVLGRFAPPFYAYIEDRGRGSIVWGIFKTSGAYEKSFSAN